MHIFHLIASVHFMYLLKRSHCLLQFFFYEIFSTIFFSFFLHLSFFGVQVKYTFAYAVKEDEGRTRTHTHTIAFFFYMAHAFDNRNFIPGKQQISHPSARSDITKTLWERSNHPSPSYDETVSSKTLNNHQNSKSFNDSSYRQRQPSITGNNHITFYFQVETYRCQICLDDYVTLPKENHNSDTKPPPPARIPRITAITNNNYISRANILPPNGMKTNTTYLNSTQLYITQPSSQDNPPPPPPRHPLHPLNPPAIPPRNTSTTCQKNSVTIPDFNSPQSPKTIYRSPAISPTVKRNDLEHRFNSLSIDNHHNEDTTTGDYFGIFLLIHKDKICCFFFIR